MRTKFICAAALLSLGLSSGETLGYVEQKFNSINFEKGKWTRVQKDQCFLYTATDTNASVEIMRYGTSNLVLFSASRKGLDIFVCDDTAALDEGFEAKSSSTGNAGGK
jgi:hypothetical protein